MSQKSRACKKGSKYGLAIVTGGSSGIGKSIIEQLGTLDLALEVFNLSRTKPSSFTNGSATRHLKCDFADRQQRATVFESLAQQLEERGDSGPILLINNAGFGAYGEVDRIPLETQQAMIEVNICALVELAARLLRLIRQRGGAIMNIASTAAFQGVPYMASYGATKAFVLNWTLALNEELRGTSARALAVCPGPTRTAFFSNAGAMGEPGGPSSEPEAVAAAALRALSSSRPCVVAGWSNKALVSLSSCAPRGLAARVAGALMRRYRQEEPRSN